VSADERRADAIEALRMLEADVFAAVLDAAAIHCFEAAEELGAAWQDDGPRRVWLRIGNALTTAARKVRT
jgi:hypothetical protein